MIAVFRYVTKASIVKASLFGALCLLSMLAMPLQACLHAPLGYKDVVTEKTKEALVFHDGKNAHLIIKTELESEGDLPPTMAWVIPLPSLPSSYKEERADLFEKLFELTPSRMMAGGSPLGPPPGAPSGDAGGIRVHASQTVGSYQVQPIEVLSEASGAELNSWLERNGFGAVPPENQKYYLKKGAVFLALKLNGLSGSHSKIKPLHIVYPSYRLSVPLKFSSHSGVFNLMLYTWSQQPMKVLPESGDSYMRVAGWNQINASSEPILRQLFGSDTGYVTRFSSANFNSPGWEVTDMKSDPSIDLASLDVLELPQRPAISSAAVAPQGSAVAPLAALLVSTILIAAFFVWFKLRRSRRQAA
ncbi:MAG TPA: DUF2330 domain-containing protein [Abditibacteriaceae bacterium]|jgi:hypothetical protein